MNFARFEGSAEVVKVEDQLPTLGSSAAWPVCLVWGSVVAPDQ